VRGLPELGGFAAAVASAEDAAFLHAHLAVATQNGQPFWLAGCRGEIDRQRYGAFGFVQQQALTALGANQATSSGSAGW